MNRSRIRLISPGLSLLIALLCPLVVLSGGVLPFSSPPAAQGMAGEHREPTTPERPRESLPAKPWQTSEIVIAGTGPVAVAAPEPGRSGPDFQGSAPTDSVVVSLPPTSAARPPHVLARRGGLPYPPSDRPARV